MGEVPPLDSDRNHSECGCAGHAIFRCGLASQPVCDIRRRDVYFVGDDLYHYGYSLLEHGAGFDRQ